MGVTSEIPDKLSGKLGLKWIVIIKYAVVQISERSAEKAVKILGHGETAFRCSISLMGLIRSGYDG